LRGRTYRLIGFGIDGSTTILGNVDFSTGAGSIYHKLTIGPSSIIGVHVTINLDGTVRIGKNVAISPFVRIYTGSHQIGTGSRRCLGRVAARPVEIGDGSWIGLGAIILPGVSIGHGSIVAAGSVVSTDVPPDTYVEGNPAKVVRVLPWGDR